MRGLIKNIIFDVDGTLVDSKLDIAGAQLWALHQLGVDSYRAEDLYRLIGKSLAETFASLLPQELHHRIPEAVELYRSYYPPRALDTSTLFPGVSKTLETLSKQGMRLATATTKSTAGTRRILEHFGIAQHFCRLQGSDEIPFKPDPTVINAVIGGEDWRRAETLMVGDTGNDIHAGKNAGIRTCGVTYGSLSKEEMTLLRPDFTIDRIQELLTII